ncbi:class I SAM-dependent methyltransferase [Luteimonas sp. RIT-PG2_3]
MPESDSVPTPRWSNVARDQKALAIWRTLENLCGQQVSRGAWLDVGCGSGAVASTLAHKVDLITGVDPEPWGAWQGFMDAHANLRLIAGEFDALLPPFPDASFDVVVCNQVYEHVRDPVALIANIHRVLKPGGVCYFAGPNLLWPVEPHVFWPFVHWIPREFAHRAMTAMGSRRAHELDAYSATFWKLSSWFDGLGFIVRNGIPDRMMVVEGSGIMARVVRRFGSLPDFLHGWLLPFMPSFIFLLRKR